MKNLLYCMFSEGKFSGEIAYSLNTAYHFLPPDRKDYRFIIYCISPADFDGLRADLVQYDSRQLLDWAGPHNFRWRIKITTLIDVLERTGEPTALLDGDTYFLRSPDLLFRRVRPGHAVLHIREGRVCDLHDAVHRDLASLLAREGILDPGTGRPVTARQAMWNAGVIGVHPSDLPALRRAIELTDAIVGRHHIPTAEQFAISSCLEAETRLRPCDDVVFHYWSMRYRKPFREIVGRLLEETRNLPEAERARRLYRARPRPSTLKHVANRVVGILDRAGIRLYPGDPRQSG